MRVRIYEVGSPSILDVHYVDTFPCTLNVDEEGGISDTGFPICELEDLGGEICYRVVGDRSMSVLVNDAELESGPLAPGDQLAVGQHRFMVSYERTSGKHLSNYRYRILD